jgi:hypothetical protein
MFSVAAILEQRMNSRRPQEGGDHEDQDERQSRQLGRREQPPMKIKTSVKAGLGIIAGGVGGE